MYNIAVSFFLKNDRYVCYSVDNQQVHTFTDSRSQIEETHSHASHEKLPEKISIQFTRKKVKKYTQKITSITNYTAECIHHY